MEISSAGTGGILSPSKSPLKGRLEKFYFNRNVNIKLKSTIKHIVARTYKPLLVKYLSKTRVYKHSDIKLEIPPQVFHPRFFFSTRLLLNYVKQLPLNDKSFLE